MGAVVLKEVTKSFGRTVACSEIDLSINKGEFFTFLGPSGCGKTTILRLVAGFISPDKGAVFLDGQDITRVPAERREVGIVFQNYALFPYLSVYQNIEYGLLVQKRPAKEIKEIVARYMEMIGLKGFDDRAVSELSGGEQQRVALARSLAIEPRVLLLDEPLSNLDARLRDKMRLELKLLQQKLGVTTIFVTHDQTEALTLSDRIAVFDQGRAVQVGTPREIYADPATSFVAGFIGDTNLFKASFAGEAARIGPGIEIGLGRAARSGEYVSVRPQDITLSQTPLQGRNVFKGRLSEPRLNGLWVDYTIRVNGTVFRAAQLNTAIQEADFRPGDDVFLSIPEQAVKILDK